MIIDTLKLICCFGCLFMLPELSLAQSSLFNNSSGGGTTSSRNTGTGLAGGSGLTSGGGLTGNSGRSGGGGLGAGGGIGGGPQFNTSLGQANSNAGANGFIGANNANNGFIGIRNATGQQNFQQQAAQFSQFNQALQGLNNRNGGNQQTERKMAPARTRIAFEFDQRPAPVIQEKLIGRMAKYDRFSGMLMQVADSGIVTLSGQVASENDRKLAEALLRLEPGITAIENRLIISD